MANDETAPIRILIVDDHPVVRAGLKSMLATYPDLNVVGCVADGDQAISVITGIHVDVVLLDLRMPKQNGIQTLAALKQLSSPARVIMLTSYESDEDIYQSVRAGAQGYLLKASSEEDMIDAIHTVYAGERYLPTDIASRLADRMPRANVTVLQNDILDMIARGITDEQIALKLHISNRTVWNQLNLIIGRLALLDEGTAGPIPKEKITIAQVAKKAGVSMSTVSRVLNGSGKHTEETKQAVMKVVKEYDFQLNATAASLAMMRGNNIEG